MLTWLTIVLFLGMMFGGYIWGLLADHWGRRKIIVYSLTVNGIFGVLSSLSESFWLLLILRFISGVGAGGSLPVCFSYFSEFQPKEYRGAMISALATFWMAGNILTAGLAWGILPNPALREFSPFHDTWRLFIIICAIPSLTSAGFFLLMPESPMFLMQRGRSEEALGVPRYIYKMNHKSASPMPFSGIQETSPSHASVGRNRIKSSSDSDLLGKARRAGSRRISSHALANLWNCRGTQSRRGMARSACKCCRSLCSTLKHQVTSMFASNIKSSLAISFICFAISFSGYGLSMWLPTLMERAQHTTGGSPCEAGGYNATSDRGDNNSTEAYVDVFIGAAAQLPANILTILVIDRTGGKPVLVFAFIASGISVLFFWLVKNKTQTVVMSALFNAVSTLVWNGVDVVTPELFDTSVRASASGFLSALSRVAAILGNMVFGFYIDSNCGVPLLTVSFVLFAGGVASLLLPNTRRISLS